MAIHGSCLCGAIRFEIDRAVGPAEYCHCNRCRKVSGSSALLMMLPELYRLRTGQDLPADFKIRAHASARAPSR